MVLLKIITLILITVNMVIRVIAVKIAIKMYFEITETEITKSLFPPSLSFNIKKDRDMENSYRNFTILCGTL